MSVNCNILSIHLSTCILQVHIYELRHFVNNLNIQIYNFEKFNGTKLTNQAETESFKFNKLNIQ